MPDVWYDKAYDDRLDQWVITKWVTGEEGDDIAWLDTETLADVLLEALEARLI